MFVQHTLISMYPKQAPWLKTFADVRRHSDWEKVSESYKYFSDAPLTGPGFKSEWEAKAQLAFDFASQYSDTGVIEQIVRTTIWSLKNANEQLATIGYLVWDEKDPLHQARFQKDNLRPWEIESGLRAVPLSSKQRADAIIGELLPYKVELYRLAEETGNPNDPFAVWESLTARESHT